MIIRVENKTERKTGVDVSVVYGQYILEPHSTSYIEPHNSNTVDKIRTIIVTVSDFD